jgi:ribosomal protein L7Ae-like RNA K-turn-binding protein
VFLKRGIRNITKNVIKRSSKKIMILADIADETRSFWEMAREGT